jgi:ligand-binding sensor domain-containing protein
MNAPAQLEIAEETDIRFVRLSSGDERAPAGVICMVQDDQGFLWLGTEDGLRRYDGYRFREYRNDPNNPNSLSGSYVYALFKDRSGKLWVGTDRFLDRYDPVTESFTHYPSDPNQFDGPVFHIREDRDGMIWLATEHGLNRVNPTTWESVRYQYKAGETASLSSDQVRCTLEDKNGTLGRYGKIFRRLRSPDRESQAAHPFAPQKQVDLLSPRGPSGHALDHLGERPRVRGPPGEPTRLLAISRLRPEHRGVCGCLRNS